jgi:hypothetical protein
LSSSTQTDKRRHLRRKVLIPARLKQDAGWFDICIRDISARGLLVQGASPPRRGSYVEIRRGAHVIVAKVAWAKDQQFGLTTQDIVPVDALIHRPDAAAFGRSQTPSNDAQPERRAAPRVSSEQAAARSRHISAMIQYGFALMFALACAVALVGFVQDSLHRSLGTVTTALAGK